jgi:hypothetical protein
VTYRGEVTSLEATMILLIGGIFIGFIAILALAHLGWFAVIPLLWAVALVAAGIRQLRDGRPPGPG